jgi:hypothetical protein
MSVRSDLDELRLKLRQLRLGLSGEQYSQLDDLDSLAERIAYDVRDAEPQKQGALSWQSVVLILGGLAVVVATVWRWPDFYRPPTVIDSTTPALPPASCPASVDARSLDAVLDALAKARSKDGTTSAATLSIGLLRDLVQGLMKAGTVTAEAGGQLLKELQSEAIKRGGEITVDFAKALIDRFIRPHDEPKPPAPAASATLAGAAVNVYCSFAPPPPVVVRPPAPPPHRRKPCPRAGHSEPAAPAEPHCPVAASAAAG